MKALFDYQEDCVRAVERERALRVSRTALVVATGGGKTMTFAEWGGQFLESQPDGAGRVLYLGHRDELIDQAFTTIREQVAHRGQTVGVVQGDRNGAMARHVVGSVATLGGRRGEKRRRMIRDVRAIVVDECHHIVSQTYLDCLRHWPDAFVLGVTATLTRADRKKLGTVIQSVAHEVGLRELIDRGRLVYPVGIRVRVDDLHLERVRSAGGDLVRAEVGEAIEGSLAPEAIAKAIWEHAPDRPTIVFAPTVHSAGVIRDALVASGLTAAVVWGEMGKDHRARVLDDYRARRVQILCNVGVLTEGTDLPLTSCIVMARPTKSRGLYQQMVGRGLRTDPGKRDCVVLDLVGASELGLASCTSLFSEEGPEQQRTPCYCSPEGKCLHAQCHEGCGCGWSPGSRSCACVWVPEERGPADPPVWVDGPLVSQVVDMLAGSPSSWLRTARGVPFLPAGERFIAVVPADPALRVEAGRPAFDVVSVHARRWDEKSARMVRAGVDAFGTAMLFAESDLTREEAMAVSRADGARKRRIKATELQRAYAMQYGIPTDENTLSSDLQQRLAVAMATERIDPCLPDWY